MIKTRSMLAVIVSVVACQVSAAEIEARQQWPRWRGPLDTGVAPLADPPTRWDEQTNIRWKVSVEGTGSSTPIVWGARVFITSAVATTRPADRPAQADPRSKTSPPDHFYRLMVICLDRQNGQVLWQHIATEIVPHEGLHSTNTYAASSPVTDGHRLIVSFGSSGIFAFDMQGKPLWHKKLGHMRTRFGWGEATSPAMNGNTVVINWDHEDQSFVVALDASDGSELWRRQRDEPTSWATPVIVQHAGRVQLVTNGTERVRSYDLTNGDVLWECGGQTVNAIPTPVHGDGVLYCMSGYRGATAVAIPLDARGDLTGTDQVLWKLDRGTPYVPSPLLVGGQIYFTSRNSAVLTSVDTATGKPVYQEQRLPNLRSLYASPVAAAGKIYFVDRDGRTVVIKQGPRPDVLSVNLLDDSIDASPALVGNQLLLRGRNFVYCIATGQ